jgi:hypothetical protein
VVVTLRPIKRQARGGRERSSRGCHAEGQVLSEGVGNPRAAARGDARGPEELLKRSPPLALAHRQ